MQNSYVYWRASHPLVFISSHLIVGIIIAPACAQRLTTAIVFSIFAITLFVLSLLTLTKIRKSYQAILISICLISWGIAIKYFSQYNALFSIPYPETFIRDCRNWVVEKINSTIVDKESNGFALAILLGIKMDMNKSLVNAYMQLGIIHIIAISGMHLEILFKNLARITQLLPRSRCYLILELFILLISVWTYTLMAFASPSIVRASVFFTIYTLGKFMGATSFMLNTIAGGILILLLFDSKGLTNIGLQLSYGAVIGIHLFYKPLFESILMDNSIIKFFWSNCCMSLAAQLTTFPILAIHFHQIAGWVLVSNFIMVPLSNYILYGLAILLILPLQFSLAFTWGKMMEKYIQFFNGIVSHWFMQTKAGTIQITMTPLQVTLYYIILLFVYLWLYLKQPSWLLGILAVISVYLLLKLFS
jgi:competence protein ComEC